MAQSTELTGNDPMEVLIAVRCEQALDRIIELLTADGYTPPSRVVYVVPGEAIVWDSCCDGGQLTGRLSKLTPHFTGDHQLGFGFIIDYWIAEIEIVLLRCAATVDNALVSPNAARLTQDGVQGAADMRTILEAINSMTEIDQDGNERPFMDSIPTWTPQGPNGGCFGNMWTFTCKLDNPA